MTVDRASSSRPSGHIFVSSHDGPNLSLDTIRCVHCGTHWVHQPGSGKVRGFCQKCNGFFCGPNCIECVPLEARLEIMEGTRNPTAVSSFGGLKLGGFDIG